MSGHRTVTLRDIATIERNIVDASAIDDGTLYVGLENIVSGGGFTGVRPVDAGELASSKFTFSPRHVLYGKLRPYLAKVARPNFSGICSTDILPILPNPDLDRGYLAWFLLTPQMLGRASTLAAGANLPRLSPHTLAEFPVPLPALREQQRISETLDKADALRTERRAALAQLDSLTESIFLDMFGDPGSNPLGWDVRALRDVVREGTVVTYGIVQAGDEYPDGVPYIRTGDIVDGRIATGRLLRTDPAIANKFKRSRVDTGDIVMSIRATVGTTAIVPGELAGANLTQGTARICPGHDVTGEYLLHCLRTPGIQQWISRQIKGATFREITLARLRELPVPVPPRPEQEVFSRRIQAVEKLETFQHSSLLELDALFASLQHRAFRGEL